MLYFITSLLQALTPFNDLVLYSCLVLSFKWWSIRIEIIDQYFFIKRETKKSVILLRRAQKQMRLGSSFDDLTRRFYWGGHFNRKLLCVRRTKTKNVPRIKSMFAWFVQECLDVQKEERRKWNDRETCFTILHILSLNDFKNNKNA